MQETDILPIVVEFLILRVVLQQSRHGRMYIHIKDNKSISVTFVQAVSIEFVPNRLFFPPAIIRSVIETDHLGDIDREADCV